jgi:branched-subunit amino acid ABC-type transport system permease component
MISLALDIISSAAILFIISSGLLIIFGVMKILNFAHAGLLSVGGYTALTVTQLGWSPWLAAPLALVAGFLAGALIEQSVMRWLYTRSLDAILAAWGLGMILVQLITITYGRQIQFVQTPLSGATMIFGETYSVYRLYLVLVAIALGIILTAILKGTRLGLNTRAVIMNDNLAQALGINSAWVRFLSFSLGSALAAMAGALITPLSSVNPNMGFSWLVSSFMIVLLSGSSLISLAVSALVLGGAQVLVSTFINPVIGGMTIVVLAAIILRIRPGGLVNE